MTESAARRWAYAAAAAGAIANALFIAFYASFAVQHLAEPRSVTATLGSAADYAGIPQNALLAVITSVVFRFLSRQQRSDHVLRIAGAMAFATAAVEGVLTVTGLLPGVSAATIGTVLASSVWLLAIGVRGARLPRPRRARVARTARLIAITILCSGVAVVTGFAIGVAAIVWTGLIVGCLAWLSIPLWAFAMGAALAPSRAVLPILRPPPASSPPPTRQSASPGDATSHSRPRRAADDHPAAGDNAGITAGPSAPNTMLPSPPTPATFLRTHRS
jgi:hypothetical protein